MPRATHSLRLHPRDAVDQRLGPSSGRHCVKGRGLPWLTQLYLNGHLPMTRFVRGLRLFGVVETLSSLHER